MRLTQEDEIVVIEANPNPSLAKEDDFAQAAAQVGISYEALIQKLLENAVRWKARRPQLIRGDIRAVTDVMRDKWTRWLHDLHHVAVDVTCRRIGRR